MILTEVSSTCLHLQLHFNLLNFQNLAAQCPSIYKRKGEGTQLDTLRQWWKKGRKEVAIYNGFLHQSIIPNWAKGGQLECDNFDPVGRPAHSNFQDFSKH